MTRICVDLPHDLYIQVHQKFGNAADAVGVVNAVTHAMREDAPDPPATGHASRSEQLDMSRRLTVLERTVGRPVAEYEMPIDQHLREIQTQIHAIRTALGAIGGCVGGD